MQWKLGATTKKDNQSVYLQISNVNASVCGNVLIGGDLMLQQDKPKRKLQ